MNCERTSIQRFNNILKQSCYSKHGCDASEMLIVKRIGTYAYTPAPRELITQTC